MPDIGTGPHLCTLEPRQVTRLRLLPVLRGWVPDSIRRLAQLGHGRAAEAWLVQATGADGQRLLCVEKVFRPGWVTRLIYRLAFQARFAYQATEDAILACFYRRRVAGAIVEAYVPGVRVAAPLYVRWDTEAAAFVLGSQFIRGRGIIPQSADPHMVRRWLTRWFGPRPSLPPEPPEEIGELLQAMRRSEEILRTSGLVGAGWQVCSRALVSTANLLRASEGYVVVDLESGIPAVLVPYYLWTGLRLGSVPLFDDVDVPRLELWLDSHEGELTARLGPASYATLRSDAQRLIRHTELWKQGEFALARHKWRVFSPAVREHFKDGCISYWRRRAIIDEATEATLRPGRRIFTRPIFLLGLLPGKIGRFAQRLCGHGAYRSRVRRFLSDADYRREQIQGHVARKTRQWHESGRIAADRQFAAFDLRFVLNALMSRCAPRVVHRWLSDPVRRRNTLIRAFLLCTSGRFQSDYARHLILCSILQWRRVARLLPQEEAALRQQLDSRDMAEYVRCYGIHVGLKVLTPLLAPLKLGGIPAFFASGNPLCLLPLLVMPACRTAVTLWRMALRQRPATDYLEALLVGMLPVVGNLAYPVQMYAKYPELSTFLLRDSSARMGRWIPIYGGRDSRVEIWAVKSVNLVVEPLDLSLAGMARLRGWLSDRMGSSHAPLETTVYSMSRWDRLVDEQLRLIAAESRSDETEWLALSPRELTETGRDGLTA
jgi:hypothetical protein